MSTCPHNHLLLPPQGKAKRRCRHCHLTIAADELGDGFCPECFEKDGERRYDFEEITETNPQKTLYRCEDCGAVIESE